MSEMKRGDYVQTWFDTGAGKMGGPQILYGTVIKAGPMTYTVRWESGITNRIRQRDPGVTKARQS